MGLFDDYTPFDSSFNYGDSFGGDDWSLPVGTETSDDLGSVYDYADDDSFNWLDDFLAGTGDDWYADVPSETGGDFTMDDLDYGGGNNFDSWLDDLYTPQEDYSDYSWLDDIFQEGDTYSPDDITGMSDEELAAAIAASDETLAGGAGPAKGVFGGTAGPKIKDFFKNLFGFGGAGAGAGGAGGGEGGLGSFLSGANPLMQFLMMKSLMGDDKGSAAIPIGGEAYGGQKFNYQDYQPTNLTPALMPGVGYANMGPPPPPNIPPPGPPPPHSLPGMMHGGDVRPGDITFAKLEPGEFVIQKPAVDAVGIETLEQINNMGNGGSYHG